MKFIKFKYQSEDIWINLAQTKQIRFLYELQQIKIDNDVFNFDSYINKSDTYDYVKAIITMGMI